MYDGSNARTRLATIIYEYLSHTYPNALNKCKTSSCYQIRSSFCPKIDFESTRCVNYIDLRQ